jgi:hypothetical protein
MIRATPASAGPAPAWNRKPTSTPTPMRKTQRQRGAAQASQGAAGQERRPGHGQAQEAVNHPGLGSWAKASAVVMPPISIASRKMPGTTKST